MSSLGICQIFTRVADNFWVFMGRHLIWVFMGRHLITSPLNIVTSYMGHKAKNPLLLPGKTRP